MKSAGAGKGTMPKSLICHLCGKNFGCSSITIHLKSCEKKWETEESQKQAKARRKLPARPPQLENITSKATPTQEELDEYNAIAQKLYTEIQQQSKEPAVSGGKGFAAKPQGVVCYICGKEYGSTSITIHIKSCQKKWEDEEAKKPQSERRPVPQPPKSFGDPKEGGSAHKEKAKLHGQSQKKDDKKQIVDCPTCGRKFSADVFSKHQALCKRA
eukprot:TRINITY_DN3828_c0_g3_i1.p1 TRINITY_DN3828_c0_g3~~TRINITY_DN3828_c0_g3_i1.p1  ORF type:complete len:214 (-),score=46.35 TRINITY_DN3828_c0_g3_i1:181-822(-)